VDVIPLTKRGAAGKKAIEVKTGDEVEKLVMPSVGSLTESLGKGGKSEAKRRPAVTKTKPASPKEAGESDSRKGGVKSTARMTSRAVSSSSKKAQVKSAERVANLPAKAKKSETSAHATSGKEKKAKEAAGPTTAKSSAKATGKAVSPSVKRSRKEKPAEKVDKRQ